MGCHHTKDVLYVKQLLGQKDTRNTTIYINLEQAIFNESLDDGFHVIVAYNLNEAYQLVEAGYEYVTDADGCKIFRKRK